MNNKRIIKRASGLCLAIMAGLFVLCTTTAGFGQTITQQSDCFTLSITTTAPCGGACDGNNCDAHCATFHFTNITTNCDFTNVNIELVGAGAGAVCFRICSPQGPNPAGPCDKYAVKTFTGHYPPGGSNGISDTFTICYAGSGPHYFKITATGNKFDPNGIDDCCRLPGGIAYVNF